MIELLHALNELSPLGLAALSLWILYRQMAGRRQLQALGDNHLTEVAAALDRIEQKLNVVADGVIYLKAKASE